ncbi:MAG: dihydroorotate dehydrogenase catalytic subunit [Actinomycetota bacterium]|jgi:dihydroorotate dehydrogenase (NAD+) catalytic subunit|nr:dihydroorotate dehydrogenase catalytic subunit [Actinomycetota bacterium]
MDLTTRIGSVELPNPVMTASGTAGHADELGRYMDLSTLGAVVVKSLLPEPWPGNPSPRVHATDGGMINSVGLQGPGIEAWLDHDLPRLQRAGARVVCSIWGRTVEEYAKGAAMLAGTGIVAVEVNLSCPNTEHDGVRHAGGRALFAHDARATEEVMDATSAAGAPRWAKLSPNTDRLVEIADAARRGGAEAVTLVNTVMAMAIDPVTGAFLLGSGERGGGLSGPAIHPIAVRAVHDVHAAHPEIPVIGVGGVRDAATARELLLAGATAVQVGTATFADPRAAAKVLQGLREQGRTNDRNR